MSFFSVQALREKLNRLTLSQDSIETLSLWIIHHKVHAKASVDVWLAEVKKADPDRRLMLFYLANDVLQNGRRKGADVFLEVFKTALKSAVTMIRGQKIQTSVERIFRIWKERKIYGSQFLHELEALVEPNKTVVVVPEVEDEQPPPDFKLSLLEDAVTEFQKFEAELKVKSTHLGNLRVDIKNPSSSLSQLKDKSEGGRVSGDFDDASQKLQDYCECLVIDVNERITMLDLLKDCKVYQTHNFGQLQKIYSDYQQLEKTVNSLKDSLDQRVKDIERAQCTATSDPVSKDDITDSGDMEIESDNESQDSVQAPPLGMAGQPVAKPALLPGSFNPSGLPPLVQQHRYPQSHDRPRPPLNYPPNLFDATNARPPLNNYQLSSNVPPNFQPRAPSINPNIPQMNPSSPQLNRNALPMNPNVVQMNPRAPFTRPLAPVPLMQQGGVFNVKPTQLIQPLNDRPPQAVVNDRPPHMVPLADRPPHMVLPTDRPPHMVSPADRPPHMVPPAERPSHMVPPAERPPHMVPPADRPPHMVPPADRPPHMVPPAERPPQMVPPADRPPQMVLPSLPRSQPSEETQMSPSTIKPSLDERLQDMVAHKLFGSVVDYSDSGSETKEAPYSPSTEELPVSVDATPLDDDQESIPTPNTENVTPEEEEEEEDGSSPRINLNNPILQALYQSQNSPEETQELHDTQSHSHSSTGPQSHSNDSVLSKVNTSYLQEILNTVKSAVPTSAADHREPSSPGQTSSASIQTGLTSSAPPIQTATPIKTGLTGMTGSVETPSGSNAALRGIQITPKLTNLLDQILPQLSKSLQGDRKRKGSELDDAPSSLLGPPPPQTKLPRITPSNDLPNNPPQRLMSQQPGFSPRGSFPPQGPVPPGMMPHPNHTPFMDATSPRFRAPPPDHQMSYSPYRMPRPSYHPRPNHAPPARPMMMSTKPHEYGTGRGGAFPQPFRPPVRPRFV